MRRILIVDDDERIRRVLTRLLEGEGYMVDVCASGAEALARLGGQIYDALVTDHVMPGMSGLELVAETSARHPSTRCVIISGHRPPPNAPRSLTWVEKPIALDRIVEALDRVA
jgi:DNA-binding NtrC family response regulator